MRVVGQGIIFLAMAGILFSAGGCKKNNIGLYDGRLRACPDSPNCVSSYATDTSHHVEPLRYTGTLNDARQAVLSVLYSMKRTRVVTETSNYIHAECKSMVFRFVDDVEFYFDEREPVIHVRSASRVGYSDLGVNRKRVEDFRRRLMRLMSTGKSAGKE